MLSAVVVVALSLASCWGSSDAVEEDLQQAEMAIAQGDMRSASSIANHIVGDRNLTDLTPRQLGRLSMVYMQLADNTDPADYVASATDCYRRAYAADEDSATAYYSGVAPELTRYALMLTRIVNGSRRALTDSIAAGDTIYTLDTPEDSLTLDLDTIPNAQHL